MIDRAQRRTILGGSDVAAILGLAPKNWMTAFQVYKSKRGEDEGEPSSIEKRKSPDDIRRTHWLEDLIRKDYEHGTGRKVTVPEMLRHPEHSFIGGNLDGITDDGRVLEIKTSSPFASKDFGEQGTDQIPLQYIYQVQQYLLVTGYEIADVVVMFNVADLRTYQVPADKELQEIMIDKERSFWQRIQDGNPPPPTTCSEAASLYRHVKEDSTIEATPEQAARVKRLRELQEQEKSLSSRIAGEKLDIMQVLGNKSTLTYGGRTLVTWNPTKNKKSFDRKRLKEEHPDLHDQYVKDGRSDRQFRVQEFAL